MKTIVATQPKFPLGQTVSTANALQRVSPEAIAAALTRHASGDWGEVCTSDAAANDAALREGDRLFSVYHDGDTKFWIITEWDRSLTTVLMPEDY